MAYSGENVVEHMVPLEDPTAVRRINDFYADIGWSVLSSEEGLMLSAVPPVGERPVDGLGYWRTDRQHRMDWYEDHGDPHEPELLSQYTRGMRLARLMDLIERPLVLPTHDHLAIIVGRGGELLRNHTHIPLRQHAGRWEMRFTDPFLFGIRLAGPKCSN
jgi:hypothetical protein